MIVIVVGVGTQFFLVLEKLAPQQAEILSTELQIVCPFSPSASGLRCERRHNVDVTPAKDAKWLLHDAASLQKVAGKLFSIPPGVTHQMFEHSVTRLLFVSGSSVLSLGHLHSHRRTCHRDATLT